MCCTLCCNYGGMSVIDFVIWFNFLHTESSYDYDKTKKFTGLHACFWNTRPLTLPRDDINLFVFVWKNGPTATWI